jgi:hypothetical protein
VKKEIRYFVQNREPGAQKWKNEREHFTAAAAKASCDHIREITSTVTSCDPTATFGDWRAVSVTTREL